jgi:hypothetical protein
MCLVELGGGRDNNFLAFSVALFSAISVIYDQQSENFSQQSENIK